MEWVIVAHKDTTWWEAAQHLVTTLDWTQKWIFFWLQVLILYVRFETYFQVCMWKDGLVKAGQQTWRIVVVIQVECWIHQHNAIWQSLLQLD